MTSEFYEKFIPSGYEVEETYDPVEGANPKRLLTKKQAERQIKRNLPLTPSYHLRVERKGRWKWYVVAYQNRLRKV